MLVTPRNVTLCQVTISAQRALNDEQIDWMSRDTRARAPPVHNQTTCSVEIDIILGLGPGLKDFLRTGHEHRSLVLALALRVVRVNITEDIKMKNRKSLEEDSGMDSTSHSSFYVLFGPTLYLQVL